MAPYERIRDGLGTGELHFQRLDAAQLVKHAFGLRTAVQSGCPHAGKAPILLYLYAEPLAWPAGPAIGDAMLALHREEIGLFASLVADAEVAFVSCTYSHLLASWSEAPDEGVRRHAAALFAAFDLDRLEPAK